MVFSIVDWSGFEQYLATALLAFANSSSIAFQACGLAVALRRSPTAWRLQSPVMLEGEWRWPSNPCPLGKCALIAIPNLPLSFSPPAQIRSKSLGAVPGMLPLETDVCKTQCVRACVQVHTDYMEITSFPHPHHLLRFHLRRGCCCFPKNYKLHITKIGLRPHSLTLVQNYCSENFNERCVWTSGFVSWSEHTAAALAFQKMSQIV